MSSDAVATVRFKSDIESNCVGPEAHPEIVRHVAAPECREDTGIPSSHS